MPAVTATVRALAGLRADDTSDLSSSGWTGLSDSRGVADRDTGPKSERDAHYLQGGARNPNRHRCESAIPHRWQYDMAARGTFCVETAHDDARVRHTALPRAPARRPMHRSKTRGIRAHFARATLHCGRKRNSVLRWRWG